MNQLQISSVNESCSSVESMSQINVSAGRLSIPFISVNSINWLEYSYKPVTCVQIIHLENGIFLHFKVLESNIRGLTNADNGPVYNDSCVEFFIDPTGNGYYYNFEFNCIGSMLLGFGESRHNRELAKPEILLSVIRKPSLGNIPFEIISEPKWWELQVFIPFSAFFRHSIPNLLNLNIRGNFYKCGNSTKVPHYVTWNPVEATGPDFHRPECFGSMVLA